MPWRQAFSCDSSILWGPNGVQTPPSFLTLRGEHSRSTRKTDVQWLRPRCRSSLKSPPTMTELRSKGTASGHSRGEKRTGRPAAGPAAWRPWASQSVPASCWASRALGGHSGEWAEPQDGSLILALALPRPSHCRLAPGGGCGEEVQQHRLPSSLAEGETPFPGQCEDVWDIKEHPKSE